jgi:RHS repeat-associated protein
MDVVLGRSYSSGGIEVGQFGWGWELSGLIRLRAEPDGTVFVWEGHRRFIFAGGNPGANASTYTAYGHPGELKHRRGGGWILWYPDGSYAELSEQGRLTWVRDRFRKSESTGSELGFLWAADGTLLSIVQHNGLGSGLTQPRSIVFEHNDNGFITKATDSTGRVVDYSYDEHGRLERVTLPEVQLSVGGASARPTEEYDYRDLGDDTFSNLDTGGQITEVRDASGQPSLKITYAGTVVTGITRGSGDDAVTVSIGQPTAKLAAGGDPTSWVVTEGVGSSNPTTTLVGLEYLETDARWQETVTVGYGDADLTTTTYLDRDYREVERIEPGGIRTVTAFQSGQRRLTFSPTSVTTYAGTEGEARPETPAMLVTSYGYREGTSFVTDVTRPGPTGPLTTHIERDSRGNPTSTTGPDGATATQSFDELGRVRTATAATGAVTTLAYDDSGEGTGELRLSTTVSATGTTTTTIVRDALGHARETTTSDGVQPARTTRTKTNALGWNLETRSATSTSRTSYSVDGRIESIQSGGGSGDAFAGLTSTTPTYTSAGMIGTISRKGGGVVETSTMRYDAAGRLSTSTTADTTTAYGYDTAGRTRTRAERSGALELPTTTYGYDAAGRLVTTTSPGAKTTTNVYDHLGRQVGRIDPAGLREDLTLTVDGQVAERKVIDGEGGLWAWEEYGYDTVGRMTTRTVHRFPVTPAPDPDAGVSLTTTTAYYDEPGDPRIGLVHTVTDPLGRVTTFDYDDAGRETLRTNQDGTEVVTTYFPDGKVETQTVQYAGPEGSWQLTTSTTYDELGRVASVTAPGGQVTTTFYDELGRRSAEISADSVPAPDGVEQHLDRLTTWSYGGLGRTVTTTRPDGAVITREYDERGQLVGYLDTDQNRTGYGYDGLGRLETVTYPDSSARSLTYLPDGEVDTLTRADGSIVHFDYEPTTGRLDHVEVTGGIQPGGITTFAYDVVGHLLEASNDDVALGFGWDSVGNQLSESLSLPGVAPELGTKEVVRSFDLGNRAEHLDLPDGVGDLVRHFDLGNRLTGLDVAGQQVWHAAYAGGRLTRIDRGNGLSTAFTYDSQGRPVDVRTGVSGAEGEIAQPVQQLALGWTEASLRRSKTRDDLNRIVERFHYDGVGHLESDDSDRVPAVASVDRDLAALTGLEPRRLEEWWTVNQVDELSRRTRLQDGRSEDFDPQHNPLHQVLESGSKGYAWDVNGNLRLEETILSDGSRLTDATYTHDCRDRLVEVGQGGATTRLVVDPLGRLVARVKQTAAGETARVYVHDGDQVVAEYVQEVGGTGFILDRRHHWGRWIDDLAVEGVDTDHDGALDTTLYPITDLLGSVQLVTDESGLIAERVEYDADGTPHVFTADITPPTTTRVAWTGDGSRPTGDQVTPGALEIGFDEWIDEGSVSAATASVKPIGGTPVDLSIALSDGDRAAVLSGASLTDGTQYSLSVEGLRDRAGNFLSTTITFSVADTDTYDPVYDGSPPQILAVMDAADGVYLLTDEPVLAAEGADLATAMSVKRAGVQVPGTTTRMSATLLKWMPGDPSTWHTYSDYQLTAVNLEDFTGRPMATGDLPLGFTHLVPEGDTSTLVAYQAPTDTHPASASAFGIKNLFQGREWHADLGLYYYRARWYDPTAGFLERDPVGYEVSPNLTAPLWFNGPNLTDSLGLAPYDWFTGVQAHIFFGRWMQKTEWFLLRSDQRIGKVFLNKSLRTIVRESRNRKVSAPEFSFRVGDVFVRASDLIRPDVLFVPKAVAGVGRMPGELYELKPTTQRLGARASTQLKIYLYALRANRIDIKNSDFAFEVRGSAGGVEIPSLVVDWDGDLYTVRVEPPPPGESQNMVFYSLRKINENGRRTKIRAGVLGWAGKLQERYERTADGQRRSEAEQNLEQIEKVGVGLLFLQVISEYFWLLAIAA